MNRKWSFISLGLLFSIFTAVMLLALIMDSTSHGFNYNMLITLALATLSFTLAYLLPQIEDQDERAEFIRLKTFKAAFIGLSITIVLILFTISLDLLSLDPIQLIKLLVSSTLIISSITWMIIAKQN